MIPERFATEYPQRCIELLDRFEYIAQEHDLTGTFSVMLASSVLLVPWERVKRDHPLRQEHGGELQAALKKLEKEKWQTAQFWQGAKPGEWCFSRIMGDPNDVDRWKDDESHRSFSTKANTIETQTVGKVLRVLRNAMAHGNIVYLDKNGHERAHTQLQHIAFLSRYEETKEQRAAAETYRLVTVREGDFLPFVRAWASWIAQYQHEDRDLRAA